ncbi:MAG: FomA family porin-like outer membrane protein [Fusobacteriaceae bacterium]
MKRLAMILGSILVVSAVASAKEVVVQPVRIEEPAMVEEIMVEEPAVVASLFKPSGYIGLEYRGYGNTEGHNDKISVGAKDGWNRGANKYSRLETTFGVQVTEKLLLEGRVRDYNNLEKNDSSRINKIIGTDTRLRLYYEHSELLTSKIEFKDDEDNVEKYEYQLQMTPYKNEGGILDMITIAPKYNHQKEENDNYLNQVGIDLYLTGNLPLGFTWENNLYLDYNIHNEGFETEMKNGKLETEKKEFVATWEFYLYNTVALYSGNNYEIDFNFEGGYDAYEFNQFKRVDTFGNIVSAKEKYMIYTAMDISLAYNFTEALSMKTGAGAEYRNWDKTEQSAASDWRWQPFAYASMNVKF